MPDERDPLEDLIPVAEDDELRQEDPVDVPADESR